ncbi:MAG: patatin-like phospholipase family protein [Leptospira sp.]|nr:patatin-like phospholipase family protein [Leptospira sp.]
MKIGKYNFGKPKIGLVLGSGAARGWSHIGVIHALIEHGIKIDIVTGTSSGAVVGAFFAADALENLERFASGHNSFRQTFSYMDVSLNNGGLVAGKKFVKFLQDHLPVKRFSNLKIPFGVVATDLISFSEIHIDDGALLPAIRASVSVPGFLSPLESQGMQLVDGGLLNPVPVNLARKLGADIVIAVDLNANIKKEKAGSFVGVLERTLSVLLNKVREDNMEKFPPDILITPELSHYKFMDFHRTDQAIQVGYDAAMEKMPEIKKLLKRPSASKNRIALETNPMKRAFSRFKKKTFR